MRRDGDVASRSCHTSIPLRWWFGWVFIFMVMGWLVCVSCVCVQSNTTNEACAKRESNSLSQSAVIWYRMQKFNLFIIFPVDNLSIFLKFRID